MTTEMRDKYLYPVIAAVALVPVLSIPFLSSACHSDRHYRSYEDVPIKQCPYLADVVEPIMMVNGSHCDDESLGLVFKDAKSVYKYVCWYDDEWGSLQPYADASRRTALDQGKSDYYVLLGTDSPNLHGGKLLPIRSPEERVFFGLLERWLQRDDEARQWNRLYDERRGGKSSAMYIYDHNHLSDHQRATFFAVVIFRKLRERN